MRGVSQQKAPRIVAHHIGQSLPIYLSALGRSTMTVQN